MIESLDSNDFLFAKMNTYMYIYIQVSLNTNFVDQIETMYRNLARNFTTKSSAHGIFAKVSINAWI